MVKMEEKSMPRRGENIYKRKDGRWEARYIYSFKEDGSPRYRSIYAADYLTVKKKQNDAKRKMDPRLFQSVRMKKNISFYGLLWLERLKPSSKESTYVRYHYLFSHYISPMIGDRLVYTFMSRRKSLILCIFINNMPNFRTFCYAVALIFCDYCLIYRQKNGQIGG